MTSIHETSDASFDVDVLGQPGTTIVDFWTPYDPACRMLNPVLERFARSHPDIRVLRHDTSAHPTVPGQLGITVSPTLVVFQDGLPLVGAIGVQDDRALHRLLEAAEARLAAIPQA